MDALEKIIIARANSRGGLICEQDKGRIYYKIASALINVWSSSQVMWNFAEERVVLVSNKYQPALLVSGYVIASMYTLLLHILIPPLLYLNKLVSDVATGSILNRSQPHTL
jgi:hypothetical protein